MAIGGNGKAIDEATAINKKNMLVALEKTLGVVTKAAEQVGITGRTHRNWMKKDPEYREAVQEIKEVSIDFVESQMFKQIKEGNATLMIFYLKTQAKSRGYIEHIKISPDNPVDVDEKSADEIKKDMLRLVHKMTG